MNKLKELENKIEVGEYVRTDNGEIKTILTHEQYDRYCFKELKESANLQKN